VDAVSPVCGRTASTRSRRTSLEVYFSPDSIELTDAAQTALPRGGPRDGGPPGAHGRARRLHRSARSARYNYGLSQRRVDAVRRFLMDKGIQLARIQAASLGPIATAGIPDVKKRRVTVRLMADQE